MATVYVNGESVDIGDARINLVQAAGLAKVEIPHYCWHKELTVVASCRMCLVEVGERKDDGSVVMQPRLMPGCQTPAKHNTVVVTNSDKVKQQQGATLEYLLLNHPLDCPICDQAGECFLQDYSYRFGKPESRLKEPKIQRMDKHHIGEQIVLFTDRCVMCTRCVRFTREVSGTGELQVINRGAHAEIDIFPGKPCNNKLAGNVVDICPVGALCSRDFLYQKRVWWLSGTESVCPGCSTGCSIRVDHENNTVYRIKPRENPQAQGPWICDEGRFGFKYVGSDARLTQVKIRQADTVRVSDWVEGMVEVRSRLQQQAVTAGKRLAIVLSPMMTIEEAYLLCAYVEGLTSDVVIAMGPIPTVGEDDVYPKRPNGTVDTTQPARFTIRAEKCPNRVGVTSIAKHFAKLVWSWEQFLTLAERNELDLAYIVGGYPAAWIDAATADRLGSIKTLIVQDILPNPLVDRATIVLPGGGFSERDGCFVNHAQLAQAIKRAVKGPGDSRSDGWILWQLAEREGLFHAASVRKEIAETIPAFAALGDGELPPLGRKLTESAPVLATT